MKTLVEDCLQLSIFKLNQLGVFKSSHSDTLEWDNGNCITFAVNIDSFNDKGERLVLALYINYYAEDQLGNKKDINSMFPLDTTPCNFGEHRYWLICPGVVEGKFCLRRVAVLYKPPNGEYFACRICHNLTYESRNLGGYKKKIGIPFSKIELKEMEMSIAKKFYKGLPTKKYSKYLKNCEQYSKAYIEDIMQDGKRRNK